MCQEHSNPFVSIIVPNFNHEDYLPKRLDSIFNQTYQNYEVILLDDFSTDNSKEELQKYAKHKKVTHCIYNEQNSGNTFLQWKKGVLISKGDFIWIAESDDYCEPNFLENLVDQISHSETTSIAYCQSKKVNNKGKIIGDWTKHTEEFRKALFKANFSMNGIKFIKDFLIFKNVIPNASAVLFKRDCIKDFRIFEEVAKLKYNGDWLFYIYLLLNNDITFINKELNYHRCHDKSVIAKAVKVENKSTLVEIEIETRKLMNNKLFVINRTKFIDLVRLNHWLIFNLKLRLFLISLTRIFKN